MAPRAKIPAKYFAAIGRIASGWAYFEMLINHAIWELANVEQHFGACVTAQIIAPVPRFKALVSLLRLRGADEASLKRLNSLSGSADELAQLRNRIVHDFSGMHRRTKKFSQLRITADRKLTFEFVEVPMHELKQTEERIKKLIADVGNAIQDAIDALPPYDKTQFSLSKGIGPVRRR